MRRLAIVHYIMILCTLIVLGGSSSTADAMGDSVKTMRALGRDRGIIGESKTRRGKETFRDAKTGITHHMHMRGATFVTPEVTKDIAYFDVEHEYTFLFRCLNWKYYIESGYLNTTEEDHINWAIANKVLFGWQIDLESPTKDIFISTKRINLPVSNQLNTALSKQQIDEVLREGVVSDPCLGGERVLAAQEAIKWTIREDLSGYTMVSTFEPIFSIEKIGNKEFIKTIVDITDGTKRKKGSIWALNYWAYRNKPEKRRVVVWVAKIICDLEKFQEATEQTYMIFETLQFPKDNQGVYPDLK